MVDSLVGRRHIVRKISFESRHNLDRYLILKRLALSGLLIGLLALITSCSSDSTDSKPTRLLLRPASIIRSVPHLINPQPQWIVISNEGDGDLTYQATESVGWMTLFGNTSGVATDSFGVNLSTGLLEEGVYIETVWVSSPEAVNSPVALEISLTIEHIIEVTSNALSFVIATGVGNPPDQSLGLSSGSSTNFEYAASWNSSWLNVTPSAGQGPITLSVGADVTSLPIGMYVDTIRFDVPTGANTPILIPCSLTVVSWLPQVNPESRALRGVHFIDANNGWAVGIVSAIYQQTGYVINTTNRGDQWDIQSLGIAKALGDVEFTSAQVGWAAGASGLVVKSTDGGASWTRKVTGDTSQYEGLSFLNDTLGWVVGKNDAVMYTNDGGTSWESRSTGSGINLTEVEFVSQDSGWVVGFGGSIFFTDDGGLNWTGQSAIPGFELRDIDMVDNMHGWAVGQNGTILSTSNAGQFWIPVLPAPDTVQFWGVSFSSLTKGWACGDHGTIYHTTDGINWTKQPTGTDEILHDVHFTDDNSGWVVGGNGVILHTETGGQ